MKMTKLDFSFFIVFLVMFIIMIISVIIVMKPIERDQYLEVQIQKGDTLWDLSQKYQSYHDLDTKEFIDWVSNVNRISKDILLPGQKF